MSGTKKRGRAIVVYGSHGPEVREQRWRESSTLFSAWRQSKSDVGIPLLDQAEAGDLADPAGMLELLLRGATVLSDEEAGSALGAKFLVDEHPELFAGVKHALGEFGGFSMEVAGRRFFLVEVAEKEVCWCRAVIRGPDRRCRASRGLSSSLGGFNHVDGLLCERLVERKPNRARPPCACARATRPTPRSSRG